MSARNRPGRRLASAAVLAAALLAAGCGSTPTADRFLGFITPYRIDIVQGNVVTAERAALVKPGMTREQVRDILGSPMLTDVFHADRWDYVFTIVRQGTAPQRRTVVAVFEGDALKRLDAPALPSEREFVASISRTQGSGKPPRLELSDEERRALPRPAAAAASAPVAPLGAVRTYPPLEPS